VVFAPELKLQPVEFGDSDALQIGEWALVIGNPMGHDLDRSVFIGVISAVKRAVEGYGVEDRYGKLHTSTQLMIQTDAAVNPGGSGGGLFNILGQLQGVPTLKISEGSMDEPSPDPGASQEKPLPVDNIGMCVPIKDAMPLIRRALETYDGTGKPPVKTGDDAAPERPRVGVLLRVLDEGLQPRRDKQIPRGLLVEEVDKGGPAQKAGVRPGDILVAWNNRPTADLNALNLAREQEDVQQPVTLTIYRSPGLLEVITGQSGDPRMLEGDYQELSLRLDNP
jgi:serine protease Do